MKYLLCAMVFCVQVISSHSFGQSLIEISTNWTSSLIFPFQIVQVDRGSSDVLVQTVKGANNILFVKAGVKNFSPTNISVVTENNEVYCLEVEYKENPMVLKHELPILAKPKQAIYCAMLLDNPRTIGGLSERQLGVALTVYGIYVKDNTLYFQVRLQNFSPIDYEIQLLRFSIRDKKRGKRTAIQEVDLSPIQTSGNFQLVKGESQTTFSVALEKFTIPDKKTFFIQVMEKNGGRHFKLRVKNKKIVKAIWLPDL